MTLELIWEDFGVVRRFSGTVSTRDIQRSIEEVHADDRFTSLRYSINDFLTVTSVDVSKATLANAAFQTIGDSHSNTSIWVAIVATDPEVKMLAGFFAAPSYMPYPARTFDTVDAARQWLAGHSENMHGNNSCC